MARDLTVGIAQITSRGRPEENRRQALDAGRALFERGAELVVLPELIVPGYRLDREFLAAGGETLDGPTVQSWRDLAAEAGGQVVGGFCERDGDRLFNSAVLVAGDGVLIHYRKLHRFGAEKEIFTPGDLGLPIAQTSLGVVGLCVCYDLRFVETARILALSGAELIAVPTAWVPGFDQTRWDSDGFCPQARGAQLQANLDQVFIACASQVGDTWDQTFLGSSVMCDPYGGVPLGPLPHDRDELAVATVDLETVRHAQDRGELINPRADRRADVYGLAVQGTLL